MIFEPKSKSLRGHIQYHAAATCTRLCWRMQSSFIADLLIDLVLKQNMWVAVIVLKLFLALLPKILAFMNTKQGISSRSGNDFGVVKKYFIFQVNVGQGHCPFPVAMKQDQLTAVTGKGA